jgi:hypothetical protein
MFKINSWVSGTGELKREQNTNNRSEAKGFQIILLFFFFGRIGVRAQGFALAKQVLYPEPHLQSILL